MKIGIDARLYTKSGIGRYISNLISELEKIDKENEYIIFLTTEGSSAYHPQNLNFKKWITDYREYSLQEQTTFVLELYRAKLDLYHATSFNIPILYMRKTLVTIHDFIMGKQDLHSDPLNMNNMYKYIKIMAFYLVNFAIKFKGLKVIVPTFTIKEEVKKKLGISDNKIYVTYEGVSNNIVQYFPSDKSVLTTRLEEMHIKNNYILYVGNFYSHKNLNSLVVAYKECLKDQNFKYDLVLAGRADSFASTLAGFSHALGLDGRVIFVSKYVDNGVITDKDLAYLYKGASLYINATREEGFSLTPLEAQSAKVPCLISDIPVHKEIFGESVFYLNPKSNIDISNKLNDFSKGTYNIDEYVLKGLENIKKYSWAKMAAETRNIYMKN